MTARPRFSPVIEQVELKLPPGRKLGGLIGAAWSPEGDLYLLHQWNPPGVDVSHLNAADYLPDVACFTAQGEFRFAWGGPDHIPAVDGISQWPAGREGIECDAEGNVWIFGYSPGDDAVLKFSPAGELLLRIGQRGKPGEDSSTDLVKGPTGCYHDIEAREVFVADGYGNHRIVAFNSDTGAFTRMWGAYGKDPAALSPEEGFGNPVHKVVCGPDGLLYVCDRIKNRIQVFERVPGGARFVREATVGVGTMMFGSCFDIAFAPDGKHMYVADGSNIRVWILVRETLEVLGWVSAANETEGDDNMGRVYGILHRFLLAPNGDLLLCCTTRGLRRMKYLGVS